MRSRGSTLLEVLAATVLLGTLLTSAVLVSASLARRAADRQRTAAAIDAVEAYLRHSESSANPLATDTIDMDGVRLRVTLARPTAADATTRQLLPTLNLVTATVVASDPETGDELHRVTVLQEGL